MRWKTLRWIGLALCVLLLIGCTVLLVTGMPKPGTIRADGIGRIPLKPMQEMFGIYRRINKAGVVCNITWDRALGYPIERPKSVTTAMLEDAAKAAAAPKA